MENPPNRLTGNAPLVNFPIGMKIHLTIPLGLGLLVSAETRITTFGDRWEVGLVPRFPPMQNGFGPATTTIMIACIADTPP